MSGNLTESRIKGKKSSDLNKRREHTNDQQADIEAKLVKDKLAAIDVENEYIGPLTQEKGIEILNSKLPQDLQLKLPDGLIQKPINIQRQCSDYDPLNPGINAKKDSSVQLEEKLLGLPGQFSLDEKTTNNYFGLNAKDNFYERYHYLAQQHEKKRLVSSSLSELNLGVTRGSNKNDMHKSSSPSRSPPRSPPRSPGEPTRRALALSSTMSGREIELAVPSYTTSWNAQKSGAFPNFANSMDPLLVGRTESRNIDDKAQSHINEPNDFSFAPRRKELNVEEANFVEYNKKKADIANSHQLLREFDEKLNKEKEYKLIQDALDEKNRIENEKMAMALELARIREAKKKEKFEAKKAKLNAKPTFYVTKAVTAMMTPNLNPSKLQQYEYDSPEESLPVASNESATPQHPLIMGKKEGHVPQIKSKPIEPVVEAKVEVVNPVQEVEKDQKRDIKNDDKSKKKNTKKKDEKKSGNNSKRPATSAKKINRNNSNVSKSDSSKEVTSSNSIEKVSIQNSMDSSARIKTAPAKKKPENYINISDDRSISSMSDIMGLAARVIPSGSDNNPYSDMYEPASPRSTFIEACIRDKVIPRASLVLRKKFTKELFLSHQAMGDDNALRLAEAITSIPYIQSIHLADNNLTDRGLTPILKNLVHMEKLLELDLSQNEIGERSAKYLSKFLRDPRCALEKLVLKSADVDDFECSRFISSVKECNTLREIDLSNNKIGSAENLNTVMPDLITGGEALASLLQNSNCHITSLNLQWNMIRLGGAIEFASSIQFNKSLTYLNLSYNSLGKAGGIALGSGILENRTLVKLYLDDNALDPEASFTICAGALENKSLEFLSMDGNPIGELGSRALMLIPAAIGYRLKTSSLRCNINIKDSGSFSFIRLLRDYHLNMENPFERAMVIILCNIIAGHHTYSIKGMVNEITFPNGKSKKTKIDLDYAIDTERVLEFNDEQNRKLAHLNRLLHSATNIKAAVDLFNEYDSDQSGQLDKAEFRNVLKDLGIEMTDKRFEEIMNQYDTDRQGNIEISEFLMFLKEKAIETKFKIKDITEVPMIIEKDKKNKNGNPLKFLPPKLGMLHFTVFDTFSTKKYFRTLTASDKVFIEDIAKKSGGEMIALIGNGLSGTKLRLDEALSLARLLSHETRDIVKILKKLLPQMSGIEDARKLLTSVCKGDRTIISAVKRELGYSYRSLLGYYNAYYHLDLVDEMDRVCLIRLLEVSKTRMDEMQSTTVPYLMNVGDLSQHGNWSCFRNEIFNGESFVINSSFANPLPMKGIIEFDFIFATRPSPDDYPISDSKVVRLLIKNLLIPKTLELKTVSHLKSVSNLVDAYSSCSGDLIYVCNEKRSNEIGNTLDEFYKNLADRYSQMYTDNDHVEIAKYSSDDKHDLFPRNDMDNSLAKSQQILLPQNVLKSREGTAVMVERFFEMVHAQAEDLSINPEKRINLTELFRRYDQNKDGRITYDEMENILHSIGAPVTPKLTKAIFVYFDKNNDKSINLGEFIFAFFNKKAFIKKIRDDIVKKEKLKKANAKKDKKKLLKSDEITKLDQDFKVNLFESYDKNRNGGLSKIEFKQYLLDSVEGISDMEVEFIFVQFDKDKTGELSLVEFIVFLNNEIQKLMDDEKLRYLSKDEDVKNKLSSENVSVQELTSAAVSELTVSPAVKPIIADDADSTADSSIGGDDNPSIADYDMYDAGGYEFYLKTKQSKKLRRAGMRVNPLMKRLQTPSKREADAANDLILKQLEKEENDKFNEINNFDLDFFNIITKNDIKSLNLDDINIKHENEQNISESSSSDSESDPEKVGEINSGIVSKSSSSKSDNDSLPSISDDNEDDDDKYSEAGSDTESIIEQKNEDKKKVKAALKLEREKKIAAKEEKKALKEMILRDKQRIADLKKKAEERQLNEKANRKKFLNEQIKNLENGQLDDMGSIEELVSQLEHVDDPTDNEEKPVNWLSDFKDMPEPSSAQGDGNKNPSGVSRTAFGSLAKTAKFLAKIKKMRNSKKLGIDSENDERLYLEATKNIYSVSEAREALTKTSKLMEVPEPSDSFLSTFHKMICNPDTPLLSISTRFVEILEDIFTTFWIRCSHLLLILEYFRTIGRLKASKRFSTFRVDVIVSLFSRIYDLANFDIIIRSLSSFEVGCLYARIGHLHIFNPLRPEGSLQLNLTRRDERVVCKMLCALAVSEPGDNWIAKKFRWVRDQDCVPGWELTQPWLTEEGLPMRGVLDVTYFSGEGKGKRGCKPNVPYRKSLTYLCLIDEGELVSSNSSMVLTEMKRTTMEGYITLKANQMFWSTYLAPSKYDMKRNR